MLLVGGDEVAVGGTNVSVFLLLLLLLFFKLSYPGGTERKMHRGCIISGFVVSYHRRPSTSL